MRGSRLLAAAAAAAAAAGSGQEPARPPRFDDGVTVQLQQLYLTVAPAPGSGAGLRPSHFEVVDDGVPQTVVSVAGGDVPFTAVVMVDCSASMEGPRLDAARAGVAAFLRGMKAFDEATVMGFSDRIALLRTYGPGTSPATAEADLAALAAGGGTRLNDHLYLALTLLEARLGRRTVILLSDGVDVHSVLDMREALHKVRYSQSLIYWIRLAGPARPAAPRRHASVWRSEAEHSREIALLAEAVTGSGGRILDVATRLDVPAAFGEVLDELRRQVVVSYVPTTLRHDQSWHRVEVRVLLPGVPPMTRGYFDF